MKEKKRKLLLNAHVNVGLLASEIFILVESKPTLLCLHWGLWVVNLSTNQMQAKIKWLGHARCPRFRQFACFYFKFSFQEVLSNNAIHLPRSVRSSHWSKASIVWTKNEWNQKVSHSYSCESRSGEEKVERKVTDADKNFTVSTPYACTSLKWN